MKKFYIILFCFFSIFYQNATFADGNGGKSSKKGLHLLIKEGKLDTPLLEKWIQEDQYKKKSPKFIRYIFEFLKMHTDIKILDELIDQYALMLSQTTNPESGAIHYAVQEKKAVAEKQYALKTAEKAKILGKIESIFLKKGFIFNAQTFLSAFAAKAILVLERKKTCSGHKESSSNSSFDSLRSTVSSTYVAKAIVKALTPSAEQLFESSITASTESLHELLTHSSSVLSLTEPEEPQAPTKYVFSIEIKSQPSASNPKAPLLSMPSGPLFFDDEEPKTARDAFGNFVYSSDSEPDLTSSMPQRRYAEVF